MVETADIPSLYPKLPREDSIVHSKRSRVKRADHPKHKLQFSERPVIDAFEMESMGDLKSKKIQTLN
jgi:hypothetical protein